MLPAVRVAKQVVRGLPYLKKELIRDFSMRTGHVLTTPITYYVIFSGKCNLACTFCTIYPMVDPILSEEAMLRVVREAKELSKSGFNISLSGGEPTIYKPLYKTLAYAQEIGVNFGFTTNALAMTRENAKRILSYDPFNINVSLESVDPTINEAVRPMKDGTARTLRGIQNVIEEKRRIGSRVSVIVKPTILEQNYRGLPDLVRHFGKDGGVLINFQPFVGKRGDRHWVQDPASLRSVLDELIALQKEGYPIVANERVINQFMEYFENPPDQDIVRHLDLNGEKRNCDIGLRAMTVYPNGDVYFCDFLKKPVGNIHKQSLSEIYHGDSAGKQRKVMVTCSIDCQQTCKRPVPLLVKARSFIQMG
jgi:MoaA/NifB/PqqE/SkfB family radical SAM enzyme